MAWAVQVAPPVSWHEQTVAHIADKESLEQVVSLGYWPDTSSVRGVRGRGPTVLHARLLLDREEEGQLILEGGEDAWEEEMADMDAFLNEAVGDSSSGGGGAGGGRVIDAQEFETPGVLKSSGRYGAYRCWSVLAVALMQAKWDFAMRLLRTWPSLALGDACAVAHSGAPGARQAVSPLGLALVQRKAGARGSQVLMELVRLRVGDATPCTCEALGLRTIEDLSAALRTLDQRGFLEQNEQVKIFVAWEATNLSRCRTAALKAVEANEADEEAREEYIAYSLDDDAMRIHLRQIAEKMQLITPALEQRITDVFSAWAAGWNPQNHHFFPGGFRARVFTLALVMKRFSLPKVLTILIVHWLY